MIMRPRTATLFWLLAAGCEITASIGSTAGRIADSATSAAQETGASSFSSGSGSPMGSETADGSATLGSGTLESGSMSSESTTHGTTSDVDDTSGTSAAPGSTSDGAETSSDTTSSGPDTGFATGSDWPEACRALPDETACRTCIKHSCCTAVEACVAAPGCFCTLLCLEDAYRPASCDVLCVPSQETAEVTACVQEMCADVCPV